MRTVLYRRWAPPKSLVKIEFTPEVLHDIRANSRGNQDRGYLFGKCRGNEVRVLAALRAPQQNDSRLAHLEPVGTYASRARGEVFLTDDDLEQASRLPQGVVLVVAGKRAGFFTRELDGSMLAVRSYEEFAVADVAAEAVSPEVLTKPGRPGRWRHPALPPPRAWRAALAASVVLAGPVMVYAYLQPRMRLPPIEMSVRENNGQLVIGWDPNALSQGGHVNISEGDIQTSISLAAFGSGITYLPQTSDVEVRLSAGGRAGALHWRSSHPQLH
jgi:hypothetical protein